jgi:hypothetical protein
MLSTFDVLFAFVWILTCHDDHLLSRTGTGVKLLSSARLVSQPSACGDAAYGKSKSRQGSNLLS